MKKVVFIILLTIMGLIIIFSACRKKTNINLTSAEFTTPTITNTNIPAGTSTNTPTITNTSTEIPTCPGELLDDMEDNNNQNNFGGYWYTYDDLNNGGSSYVVPWSDSRWSVSGLPTPEQKFYMQSPGRGNSNYAAHMTGYVTTQFQYGFVGMGSTFLEPKDGINVSECTSIRFWHKGDGKTYRMKISSNHPDFLLGEADNHYGRQFETTTEWTLEDIPMAWLTQEMYWGTSVNLNDAMSRATDIQFQSSGYPIASIDLWIDDIQFCGCNLSYMLQTPTPAITPGKIDDMEDGDAINNWGGVWYTYDDSSEGGDSYVVPIPSETFTLASPGRPKANGTPTDYAARITGNVTNTAGKFVGMGTNFSTFDLSSCTGIKFWVKGDGKDYYIKIASAHPGFGTSTNYYGVDFFTSGEWQQFNVLLNNLYQIGTGPVVSLTDALSMATGVLFESMHAPVGNIELWIDDVEVYGCSSYPIP